MNRNDLLALTHHPRVQLLLRPPRLAATAIFIILVLAIWIVTASVKAERSAHSQLLDAHSKAATIDALASEFNAWKARIAQQTQNHVSFPKPLLDTVTKKAAEHDLALSDISASGEQRLSVRAEDATFEQAVTWLYDLHTEDATQIGNTTFQGKREPGKVTVQTTLYR